MTRMRTPAIRETNGVRLKWRFMAIPFLERRGQTGTPQLAASILAGAGTALR
jgi:hypothetical protein